MLDVATYRLATHLGLAFVILGLIAWYVLLLGRSEAELLQARRGARPQALLDDHRPDAFRLPADPARRAGGRHRRRPQLSRLAADGRPVLAARRLSLLAPFWRNFFEDAGLVQFMHRMAGYLLFVFGIVVWLRGAPVAATARTRRPSTRSLAMHVAADRSRHRHGVMHPRRGISRSSTSSARSCSGC